MSDIDDYKSKWVLVQPSRELPPIDEYDEGTNIETPEDMAYRLECEEEEEYNRQIIFKKKGVEINFNTISTNKKKTDTPKPIKEKLPEKNKKISLLVKEKPTVRQFNPRLPPPDKYNQYNGKKSFKLSTNDFPSL